MSTQGMNKTVTVRPIEDRDVDDLLRMMASLSEHEGAPPPPMDATEIRRWGLGEHARFGGLVAERGGRIVGYLFHHDGFHIGQGRPGLVLMDLFVEQDQRGHGVGSALMAALARAAQARQCGWISLQVHPDNPGAMDFYRAIGARRYRAADYEIAGMDLRALAEGGL